MLLPKKQGIALDFHVLPPNNARQHLRAERTPFLHITYSKIVGNTDWYLRDSFQYLSIKLYIVGFSEKRDTRQF